MKKHPSLWQYALAALIAASVLFIVETTQPRASDLLLSGVSNPGVYCAEAVEFDGSTYTTGSPTVSDGKQGTFAAWLNPGATGTIRRFFTSDGARVNFTLYGGNGALFVLLNSAGAGIFRVRSPNNTVPISVWTHVLLTYDLSVPSFTLLVNGQPNSEQITLTDDTVGYDNGDFSVGAYPDGTAFYTGDIAELWFDDGAVDLSNPAIVAGFFNGVRPANIGTSCQNPTGSAPLICFKGAATSWNTNLGTAGGSFSTTAGTLTDAATNPSGCP